MGRLADSARETETALARMAEMLVGLADRAEADDDERAELADLLVTLGLHGDATELDELDPNYDGDQADDEGEGEGGDGG